jgi:hypothetical protein
VVAEMQEAFVRLQIPNFFISDLLVRGNETEDWLGGRDSNPDNVVQSHGSYR